MYTTIEKINGISSNIMLGQTPKIGTLYMRTYLDVEKMNKPVKKFDPIIDELF